MLSFIQLYQPCQELAFKWMRLVSAQIQSISYKSADFLNDMEMFACDIRGFDGIDKGGVEVFNKLVGTIQDEVEAADSRSNNSKKTLKHKAEITISTAINSAVTTHNPPMCNIRPANTACTPNSCPTRCGSAPL